MISILGYLNGFARGLGVKAIELDLDAMGSVVRSLHQEFPHKDGLEKASVFKKAAHFLTYFVALRPVQSALPPNFGPEKLRDVKNPENAVIAFEICVDALHHAVVRRSDQKVIKLDNRVTVSDHSYVDIVDALTCVTPRDHFKMVSVLLEQLAYRANPDASYPVTT
jgi:hypothetical protein